MNDKFDEDRKKAAALAVSYQADELYDRMFAEPGRPRHLARDARWLLEEQKRQENAKKERMR